ncbi:DUF2306 domain-containing protein [Jeongeupia sp. HS-3]|uniref:DUF2306 domain-containing protein n=1 Tax=Jeongeupia sp. HS-3 TaxID=1009682 RepID=UPI00190FD116|nr:DUF2306 domain-containing protein [Jeongeupia sp. HS-3]
MLDLPGAIHLSAAAWVIAAGTSQLLFRKGTRLHRLVGWSWMLAMVIVAVSSFWLHSAAAVWLGLSAIHLLSLWVLFCVGASTHAIRQRHIPRHKSFATGAYVGAIVAGVFALTGQNRFLQQWISGL